MPSNKHQGLLQLFRNQPALAAELVCLVGKEPLPPHDSAQLADAGASPVTATEYTADTTVVLRQGERPVYAIVVEVQLRRDPDKRYSWPYYVAAQRCRLQCACCLLVLAPDRGVAGWAATPIDLGQPGYPFAPLVVDSESVPIIGQVDAAVQRPELAVLSALAHGRREYGSAVATAAVGALIHLDDERKLLYYDLVLDAVCEATRLELEALMKPEGYEYQSDFARKYYGAGVEKGLEEGRLDEKLGIARKLLAIGRPPAEVAEVTGLSLEEVQKLAH